MKIDRGEERGWGKKREKGEGNASSSFYGKGKQDREAIIGRMRLL